MQTELASINDRIKKFINQCVPSNFPQLLNLAEFLNDTAARLESIESDELFEGGFISVHVANNRFLVTAVESHAMSLFENTDTGSGSASLEYALGSPLRRMEFLHFLSASITATICGLALKRANVPIRAWFTLCTLVMDFPLFAAIVHRFDEVQITKVAVAARDRLAQDARKLGYDFINLDDACQSLLVQAGIMWLKALVSGMDRRALEECRHLLFKELDFLRCAPIVPWSVRPYTEISSGDSLAAILQELLRHPRTLRQLSFDDQPLADLTRVGHFAEYNTYNPFLLTTGKLAVRRYIVEFPPIDCFVASLTAAAWDAALNNPLPFIRSNLSNISASARAVKLQVYARRVDESLSNDELKVFLGTVGPGMTGFAVAFSVTKLLGLPKEAEDFLTVFFVSLAPLLKRLR